MKIPIVLAILATLTFSSRATKPKASEVDLGAVGKPLEAQGGTFAQLRAELEVLKSQEEP